MDTLCWRDITSLGLKVNRAMDFTRDPRQWRPFIRNHHRQMVDI